MTALSRIYHPLLSPSTLKYPSPSPLSHVPTEKSHTGQAAEPRMPRDTTASRTCPSSPEGRTLFVAGLYYGLFRLLLLTNSAANLYSKATSVVVRSKAGNKGYSRGTKPERSKSLHTTKGSNWASSIGRGGAADSGGALFYWSDT